MSKPIPQGRFGDKYKENHDRIFGSKERAPYKRVGDTLIIQASFMEPLPDSVDSSINISIGEDR